MFDDFEEWHRPLPTEVSLHGRSGGSGPAVVLLHGHPRAHTTWHQVAPLLAEAGTSKNALTHAYIWLKHGTDFDAMNGVWDTWVSPGAAPARACVEAPLADPRLLVEIQVFALKP